MSEPLWELVELVLWVHGATCVIGWGVWLHMEWRGDGWLLRRREPPPHPATLQVRPPPPPAPPAMRSWNPMVGGYQPTISATDPLRPPQGGSGVPTANTGTR